MEQLEVEIFEDDILGTIVVIKKDSTDGGTFPLLRRTKWLVGHSDECELRIKNPTVKDIHVVLSVDDLQSDNYVLQYLALGPTSVNGIAVPTQSSSSAGSHTPITSQTLDSNRSVQPKTVKHGDMFKVGGRAFRVEYPVGHHMRKRPRRSSTMMPIKNPKLQTPQRINVMRTPTKVTKQIRTPQSVSKRRVTFGNRLSPEIFDYRRPPDTPVRKGRTPIKTPSKERRSIIKDTPLTLPALRETKELSLLENFELTSDEDEEPSKPVKTPSIEKIEESNLTPTTPAEKKKARRKSSLFKPATPSLLEEPTENIESSDADTTLGLLEKTSDTVTDFEVSDDDGLANFEQDMPKMDSTPSTPKGLNLTELESISSTPRGLNLTDLEYASTPSDQMAKVTTVGSLRKNAAVRARTPNLRSSARRRTCGFSASDTRVRIKRFSADPEFLAKAIKLYGMNLMKKRLIMQEEEVTKKVFEILEKENYNPNQKAVTPKKAETPVVELPSTPILNLPKPLLERKTSIVVGHASILIDATTPDSEPLGKSPLKDEIVSKSPLKDEIVSKSPLKDEIVPKSPMGGEMAKMLAQKQLPTTPEKESIQNIFDKADAEKEAKRLAESIIPQKGVTPGVTAMKNLFAEYELQQRGNQTPHQLAMKNLFKEEKDAVAAESPIQGELHQMFNMEQSLPIPSVKNMFSEAAHEMKTPDGKAMRAIFDNENDKAAKEMLIPQNPVTPGPDAMKGLFGSEAVSSCSKIFESPGRDNIHNPFATPGRGTKFSDFADSAFKHDETKQKDNQVTPGQTAMKSIFEPGQAHSSPLLDPSALRNVFGSPNGSFVDLDNEDHVKAVEKIQDDVVGGDVTMKQLFAEEKNTPEQVAMHYLLEGEPVQINFDDEISTTTASIKNFIENPHPRRSRSSARKNIIGKKSLQNEKDQKMSVPLFPKNASEEELRNERDEDEEETVLPEENIGATSKIAEPIVEPLKVSEVQVSPEIGDAVNQEVNISSEVVELIPKGIETAPEKVEVAKDIDFPAENMNEGKPVEIPEEIPKKISSPRKRVPKARAPVARVYSRRTKKNSGTTSSEDESQAPTPTELVKPRVTKTSVQPAAVATPIRRSSRKSVLKNPEASTPASTTKRRPRQRNVDPEDGDVGVSPTKQVKVEEKKVPGQRARKSSNEEEAEVQGKLEKPVRRRKRNEKVEGTEEDVVVKKPARKRVAKKEEVTLPAEAPVVEKPKRSRAKKDEELDSPEEAPVAEKPKRSRAKKAEVHDSPEEDPVAEKPKRSRAKKDEELDSPEEGPVAGKPKRSRAKKGEVLESPEEAPVAEKPKRSRAKKAVKVANVTEFETPSSGDEPKKFEKRSTEKDRKAKTVEVTEPSPEKTARKSRAKKSTKTSSDEVSMNSSEGPTPSKGRSTRSKVLDVTPEIEMEHVETKSCLRHKKKELRIAATVSFDGTTVEGVKVEAETPKRRGRSKKTPETIAAEKPKRKAGPRKTAKPEAEPVAEPEAEPEPRRSARSRK